jgi:hypothetical protein
MPRRPPAEYPMPPRPRGGRRPGAGAPRGNTNALKTGAHSRRYADAIRLIAAIPAYRRQLNADDTETGVRRQRNLLEAVRHVIVTTAPARGAAGRPPGPGERNLAMELESLIYVNLRDRPGEVSRSDGIFRALNRPIDRRRPLRRALVLTTWCAHHDEELERILTNHVLADLEPTLDKIAKCQTNNQAPRPGPKIESTEAP